MCKVLNLLRVSSNVIFLCQNVKISKTRVLSILRNVVLIARFDTVLSTVVVVHRFGYIVNDISRDLDESTSLVQIESARSSGVVVNVITTNDGSGHVTKRINGAAVLQSFHDIVNMIVFDAIVLGEGGGAVSVGLIVLLFAAAGVVVAAILLSVMRGC